MAIKLLGAAPSGGTDGATKGYVDSVLANLVAVSASQAAVSADVALTTSATWYTGPSISLSAGTYFVIAVLQHWRTTTTAENIFGRISDGTNHYASGQFYHASVAGAGSQLILAAKITLAATTTINGQMTSSAGASTSAIKAAMTANGAGNNASQIIAIRLDGQQQVAGRYVGINAQTGTTYTPVLSDENSLVTLSNASAITVTLPQDSELAFPVGGRIDFAGIGAGLVTFAAGTGATVNGTPSLVTRARYSAVTAIKVSANTWLLVGDLA